MKSGRSHLRHLTLPLSLHLTAATITKSSQKPNPSRRRRLHHRCRRALPSHAATSPSPQSSRTCPLPDAASPLLCSAPPRRRPSSQEAASLATPLQPGARRREEIKRTEQSCEEELKNEEEKKCEGRDEKKATRQGKKEEEKEKEKKERKENKVIGL
jgi:hypothetical protein